MEKFKLFFIKAIDLIDCVTLLGLSWLLVQIKEMVGIIAFVVTVSYTLWKWKKEIAESKQKTKKTVLKDEENLG